MKFRHTVIVGFGILLSLLAFQMVRADDSPDSAPLPLSLVEGRLTLTSGTPVTTADVSAAGTLYFTPSKGNRVYLYDGTRWKLWSFNELSSALSSIIPGGIVSGKNYDIFLQDSGAGLVLSASSAWTNDTTRADSLALQDGVYVSSDYHTLRYLGTIRASANNVTEDSVTKRFVWNYYNRLPRKLWKTDATASWTYGTTTWRSLHNSTANRVEVVVGQAEAPVELTAQILCSNPLAYEYGVIGIDEDGTSSNDADIVDISIKKTAGDFDTSVSRLAHSPPIGYHFYQMTEYASTATSITFYGTFSDVTLRRNGMVGWVEG